MVEFKDLNHYGVGLFYFASGTLILAFSPFHHQWCFSLRKKSTIGL